MIKYILSHPIQYQVPLIRYLNKRIKLKVVYRLNTANKKYFDREFNKKIIMSNDLLYGYKYSFLNYFGPRKISNLFPLTYEFVDKIFLDKSQIIWIHGVKNWYNLIIIFLSFFLNKKVFVRDELNLIKKKNFANLCLNKLYYFIINKFIDCYLSIGKENLRAYKYFGVSNKKIFKVPYVVNNNFFYVKKKNYKGKLIILFTGKLIHRKGCDILLESINLLNTDISFKKNTKINIVGDGILKPRLLDYKIKNNLDNVNFVGFKDQKLIKKYYKNSHIFVIPSREENWGLSVNEAMSSKNAIISSNFVGSAKDLVKNNYNGFTFKNSNSKDLAEKIFFFFKNKEKIKCFGDNSYKIISRWTFEECFNGLDKAIKYVNK